MGTRCPRLPPPRAQGKHEGGSAGSPRPLLVHPGPRHQRVTARGFLLSTPSPRGALPQGRGWCAVPVGALPHAGRSGRDHPTWLSGNIWPHLPEASKASSLLLAPPLRTRSLQGGGRTGDVAWGSPPPLPSGPHAKPEDTQLSPGLYWCGGACSWRGWSHPPARPQASCLEAQPEHAAAGPVVVGELLDGACGDGRGQGGAPGWYRDTWPCPHPVRAAQSGTRQAEGRGEDVPGR